MATVNPWYGYKRIAVTCCRAGAAVKDRQAYAVMKARGLLHKPKRARRRSIRRAKLFELFSLRTLMIVGTLLSSSNRCHRRPEFCSSKARMSGMHSLSILTANPQKLLGPAVWA
jgi:hypothetical protein